VPDRYLLYHVNNEVVWIHDGKREPARRGIFIQDHHALFLSSKADVMLIQNDGKSILLKEAGNFSFQQIKSRFSKLKETGVTSAFFTYVFEKFLKGEENETKQKITGVVFRGNELMQSPADSSFVIAEPVTLSWKTKQPSIPHKISITCNGITYDTLLRKRVQFSVPTYWVQPSATKGKLIRWKCYPADSKQADAFASWLFLVPASNDATVIQHQLKQLRMNYKEDPSLLKMMERDLLERWIEVYQLQEK
jgi:hypothetical protein